MDFGDRAHAHTQAQAQALRDIGRRHLDDEDAERRAALLRPGVRLAVAEEADEEGPEEGDAAAGPPTAGRLGGLPRLPDEADWPSGPDGAPLALVATVDCGALPAGALDLPLPTEGSLAFFASVDQTRGRVLRVPAGVPGGVHPAPPGAAVFPAVRLVARPELTAPFPEHPRLRAAFGLHAPQDFYDHPLNAPSFLDELAEHGHRFEHRVGGYAVASGVAEYQALGACAAVTDPSAATARDIMRAREWVLLAQFHHEPAAGMLGRPDDGAPAGRRGALVWLIRQEGLVRGDFDAAVLVPRF
ncbi:DUF1963 domain-containing protein [Streptomyces erythrochromogenes]|uniref:DUF1963 domain-containing protein n=1 Tax=Streptomyces erythrochromogenes TaxID=285574 RepID=UPI003863B8D4|nr:YwqG family protein [Streptomyces erythrochromogenes]